jgi:hypothetical protein
MKTAELEAKAKSQLKARRSVAVAGLQRVAWADLATYSTPVRGSLTIAQSGQGLPFAIARIFYIYGATKDCERGAHAHYDTQQAFVAIHGSFSLELTDGDRSRVYVLERPDRLLYVPPMIWARLYGFSPDAICLVLASSLYDPTDYIREWDDYLWALGKRPDADQLERRLCADEGGVGTLRRPASNFL